MKIVFDPETSIKVPGGSKREVKVRLNEEIVGYLYTFSGQWCDSMGLHTFRRRFLKDGALPRYRSLDDAKRQLTDMVEEDPSS